MLHTSGSTGLPKPVLQTRRMVSVLDAYHNVPSLGCDPTYPAMCGKQVYSTFPLFHCAGVLDAPAGRLVLQHNGGAGTRFPRPRRLRIQVSLSTGMCKEGCMAPTTLADLSKDPAPPGEPIRALGPDRIRRWPARGRRADQQEDQAS